MRRFHTKKVSQIKCNRIKPICEACKIFQCACVYGKYHFNQCLDDRLILLQMPFPRSADPRRMCWNLFSRESMAWKGGYRMRISRILRAKKPLRSRMMIPISKLCPEVNRQWITQHSNPHCFPLLNQGRNLRSLHTPKKWTNESAASLHRSCFLTR